MTEQRTSRYHIIARALLVVVIMLSQCLIWWPAAKTAVSAPDSSPAPLRVSVFHGEEYGSASVGIAGQPRSSPEAAAERLCRTIATAASKGAIPPVHLRVSGAVRQHNLELLRQAILEGAKGTEALVTWELYEEARVSPDTPNTEVSPRDETGAQRP